MFAHVASCIFVLLYFAKFRTYLKMHMYVFLVFLPYIGPACIFTFLKMIKAKKYHSEFSGEEEPEEIIVAKEKIRDEVKEVDKLVPLTDALVMNNSFVRRRMILDIINDDSEEHLPLIREASLNDDTEVVHYATTIISEISAKYEKEIKSAKEAYLSDPDDEKKLYRYASLLKRYLENRLVFGELEKMKRAEYSGVLKEKLKFRSTIQIHAQIIENEIALQNFAEAQKYLDRMKREWPLDEWTWILEFKFFCKQNQMDRAKEIAIEAGKNNIYFSTKYKSFMSFFLEEEEAA